MTEKINMLAIALAESSFQVCAAGPERFHTTAVCRGHDMRLLPAAYMKPFVKRPKNDLADAEAIAGAAVRPTMRFVAVKSAKT